MKHNKTIIMSVFFFLLLISSVFAVDYTTPSQRWSFDDTDRNGNNIYELVNLRNNMTNSGADLGRTCKFGECGFFDGSDIMTSINVTFGNGLATYSLCGWANTTTVGSATFLWGKNDGGVNAYQSWNRFQETPDDLWYAQEGATILQANEDYTSTIATGSFVHICYVYDGSNITLHRNGNFINSVVETGSTTAFSYVFEVGGINGGGSWVGEIDELCFYENYVLTSSDITNLQTNTCAAAPAPPSGVNSTNTSLFAGAIDFTNFTFGSATFVTAFTGQYNLSKTTNMSLLSSFNIEKLTGGGTDTVYGRITINGVSVSEEILRTVTAAGTIGATGFNPLSFESSAGTNNITIEFRRVGNGNILIDNGKFYLGKLENTLGNFHRGQLVNAQGSYTGIDNFFVNLSVDGNLSERYFTNKITVESTLLASQEFSFLHINDGHRSPYGTRTTPSGTFGAVSLNWIDDGFTTNDNYTMVASTSTSTAQINTTILNFDLRDNENNTVKFFTTSNSSTNITNTIIIPTGKTMIMNYTYDLVNGTGLFFSLTASLTGSVTPTLILNDTTGACRAETDRTFSGGNRGNMYLYYTCFDLTPGTSYDIQVFIETPGIMTLYDESLSAFEITEFDLDSLPTFKSVSINNDMVNNTINYNQDSFTAQYNLTFGEDNVFEFLVCDFNVNDIFNQTQGNRTNTTAYNFTIPTIDIEDDFTFEINCSNTEVSNTTGVFNYKIDTIEPQIVVTGIANGSVLYRNRNLFYNTSTFFNDTNLFAMNYTLYQLNDDLSINHTINSTQIVNLTGPTFNFTAIESTDFLNISMYQSIWFGWDSHTKAIIKVKDVKDIDDSNFKGYEYDGVKIKAKGAKSKSTKKEVDRYTYDFEFYDDGWQEIYVEGFELFDVYEEEYGEYLVDWETKQWIDFVSDDVEEIVLTKQSKKGYKIDIKPKPGHKYLHFESIGDLNENNVTAIWNLTNGFTFFAIDAFSGVALTNFTIEVINSSGSIIQTDSTTGFNLTMNITTGNFTTNITIVQYVENTSVINYTTNGSFTWNLFRENSLLLTFFDEDNGQLINYTNIDVQAVNLNNISFETNTSTGTAFLDGFGIGDYTLQFNSPLHKQNTFFVNIASSSTQQIELFLVNGTIGELVVFNIIDEKGNPLQNRVFKRLRYIFRENAFVVTGMSLTDENGNTPQYIEPNDVFYQFILENQDGDVEFLSSSQKITADTVFLKVNLIGNVFASYELLNQGQLTTLLAWNNDTNVVSFTFNDATGLTNQGCLRVVEQNTFDFNIFGPVCANASAATVTINMSGLINNNSMYTAEGTIETDTVFSTTIVNSLIREFNTDYQTFGDPGLLFSLYLIITAAFVGITINFSVALIYVILAMIIVNTIGLTFLGFSLITGVAVVGIIVAVAIRN